MSLEEWEREQLNKLNKQLIMILENGKITILISAEGTTIELHDQDASITFARIRLTPEQLSQALSRLSHTECKIELHALDKIGSKHENKKFVFEIPEGMRYKRDEEELNRLCLRALEADGMSEWKPDKHYSSQDSFFDKNSKEYARVTIRRWIKD